MVRLALSVLVFMVACATGSLAQDKVRPIAGHDMKALGAYGYDLVKLLPGGTGNPNDGTLVMGDVRYRVEHKEVTFLFSSAETKAKFEKDPTRYLPGAGGYCLLGLHRRAVGAPHVGDMPPVGHPAARTFANGMWYFHGGLDAEKEFEADPDTINQRATQAAAWYFDRLKKNSGQ